MGHCWSVGHGAWRVCWGPLPPLLVQADSDTGVALLAAGHGFLLVSPHGAMLGFLGMTQLL